jgi:predicted AAA+ superfamily ATPase
MFFKNYFLKEKIKKNSYFIWNNKIKNIQLVKNYRTLNLDLIIGVDNQKTILLNNTNNFAIGNFTNNALLWGARGNGKSSLIKSVFHEISLTYQNLKLIQLNKDNIFDIELIYTILEKLNQFRFIIFIDDLSFEKIDSDYKIIKSTLDGSIQNQPTNILLYVSSNRRHLMPRDMIDNEKSSAIHTDESVEEKISLSDRFGLWIGFHKLSQAEFLKIIEAYCQNYQIIFNENLKRKAIQWSLQRGNRTGRTAWQFIIDYASKENLKINI